MHKMLHSLKISAAAHAVCLEFNPCDLAIAVGTSSKCVKYWELEEYKLVSSTTIEMSEPRALCFNKTGEATMVAFDDCTRVYQLDVEVKPRLLDIIQKPYRMVMDMQISDDGDNLYCLDSNGFLGNIGGDPSAAAKMKTNELYL